MFAEYPSASPSATHNTELAPLSSVIFAPAPIATDPVLDGANEAVFSSVLEPAVMVNVEDPTETMYAFVLPPSVLAHVYCSTVFVVSPQDACIA